MWIFVASRLIEVLGIGIRDDATEQLVARIRGTRPGRAWVVSGNGVEVNSLSHDACLAG